MKTFQHKTFFKPVRTKKSGKAKSFSQRTITEAYERDGVRCSVCHMTQPRIILERTPHHIFYRSELYSDIINWVENAAIICTSCHAAITHKTPENKGREKDIRLKEIAMERFANNPSTPKEALKELERIYTSLVHKQPNCTCGYAVGLKILGSEKHITHNQKCPLFSILSV